MTEKPVDWRSATVRQPQPLNRQADDTMPLADIKAAIKPNAAHFARTRLLAHLQQRGILATGLYRLRFATHLDVDEARVDRAIAAVREFFHA